MSLNNQEVASPVNQMVLILSELEILQILHFTLSSFYSSLFFHHKIISSDSYDYIIIIKIVKRQNGSGYKVTWTV